MGKILLTSSQVNVLVTSVIIILCGSALFISGYVIQQRTLRELRVAIKPRQSRPSPKVSPNLLLPERFKTPGTSLDDGTILIPDGDANALVKQQQQVIEVKPTVPEEKQKKEVEKPVKAKAKAKSKQAKKENKSKKGKDGDKAVEYPWAVEHPDPLVKTEKPISRAERRRLIKEEIRKLSQADKPMYYQRRLW